MRCTHTKYIWPLAYIGSNCTWATMEKWWIEQERIQRERERWVDEDREDGGCKYHSSKEIKYKWKIKSNHGCETLPGIPDQCRTLERPRKHTTTNTHHPEPNWSKSKTPLNRNQEKEKLPLLYQWHKFYVCFSLLGVYSSFHDSFFAFLKRLKRSKCTNDTWRAVSLLSRISLHPLWGRTLCIHIHMSLIWMLKSKQPYLYNCVRSKKWCRKW